MNVNDQKLFNKLIDLKIPKPYVHPRVFFTAEEIDLVAEHAKTCDYASGKFEALKFVLDNTTKKEGAGEYILFNKLATGDTADLIYDGRNLFKDFKLTKQWSAVHDGGIMGVIWYDAFYALLTKDEKRLEFLAKVAANYIKYLIPVVEEYSKTEAGKTQYRDYHFLIGHQAIGHAYDFLYNQMSEETRKDFRYVISMATYEKNTYGMDFPRHFNNNNWTPCDSEYALNILAIEGEEGYYEYGYKKMCEMYYDFFEHGVSKQGVFRESNGKSSWVNRYAPFMFAALRRGDLVLPEKKMRKFLEYQAQCIEPFGKQMMNHGDAAPAMFSVATAMFYKLLFKENKYTDLIIANALCKGTAGKYYLDHNPSQVISDILFGCSYNKDIKREDLSIPLSLVDVEDYGTVITRSGDDKDALYMQFEARCDHRHVGHQHNDAGNFTISALGRVWACESPGMKKGGAYHSIVQIDGKSQGNEIFFEPNVNFQKAIDNELVTLGSADIKYAYDYMWSGPHHPSWFSKEKSFLTGSLKRSLKF